MVYIGAIFLFIASLVQAVVMPQSLPVSARPHFVVLLVVAVCLAESLYDATMWAFVGGIMLDLMNGPIYPLGSNALILLLIALLASLGQANPFHNLIFVPLVTVFAATIFYYLMTMGLLFALGHHEVAFVDNMLRVALPGALLNAILMPVAYSAMLWLSERVGRRVRVEW
ncbi:MAG TPA: rod shape-determining protein MreD [Chloroflexia bacterium]|nr:rod shape-determining protein MreD [Chloroflexia bacterium]